MTKIFNQCLLPHSGYFDTQIFHHFILFTNFLQVDQSTRDEFGWDSSSILNTTAITNLQQLTPCRILRLGNGNSTANSHGRRFRASSHWNIHEPSAKLHGQPHGRLIRHWWNCLTGEGSPTHRHKSSLEWRWEGGMCERDGNGRQGMGFLSDYKPWNCKWSFWESEEGAREGVSSAISEEGGRWSVVELERRELSVGKPTSYLLEAALLVGGNPCCCLRYLRDFTRQNQQVTFIYVRLDNN